MTIFDVLTMIGGLAMFLMGMSLMGDALEKRAGGQLKTLLGKLTSNPLKGFALGLAVTAVIQSSSATTVMVVGFVNSAVMTLKQAIYIIMGANVGTTVTSWLLSLTGVSGDNIVMQLLKPTSFTPVLALIGIIFYMFIKNEKKKDIGMILLGFSILMFGMDQMSGAVKPLANVPEFTNILLMFQNPIMGILAGAVLTAVIQSSSASVGILQALSATGAITFGSAIPIIMGQNIGTCVTAMLSSVGTTKNARRAAMVHLYFNIIGTIVMSILFYTLNGIFNFAFVQESANQLGIAIVHTVFNVICTATLLPLGGVLEKLAIATIRDDKKPEHFALLDERLFVTPPVAIERARSVTVMMADAAVKTLKDSFNLLTEFSPAKAEEVDKGEDIVDHFEDQLGTYLVKLSGQSLSVEDSHEVSKLLRMIGDLERISDHAVNVKESAEEMFEKKQKFSDAARKEIQTMIAAVEETLEVMLEALQSNDLATARKVEPLEEVIDNLQAQIKKRHAKRLTRGECTIELGFVLNDLLTNLERVSDHCSNVAICMIEIQQDAFDTHQYLLDIDKSKSSEYARQYAAVASKYSLGA